MTQGGRAVGLSGGPMAAVMAILVTAGPPDRLPAQDPGPLLDRAGAAYEAAHTLDRKSVV